MSLMYNRAFDSLWKQNISCRKRSSSDPQFVGWKAQYQIWNVESRNPTVIEDSYVHLNSEEVQMQCEGFENQRMKYPADGSQNIGPEFALHFPISIAEDLQRFTVLTTVFVPVQPWTAHRNSETTIPAAKSWRAISVPVLSTIHAPMLKGFANSPSPSVGYNTVVARSSYFSNNSAVRSALTRKTVAIVKMPTYQLFTYRDYIMYQSNEGCGVLIEEPDTMGTLAVYQASGDEQSRVATLLGCVESNGRLGAMSHATFHPNYPLLAFQYLSARGEAHTVLWHFSQTTDSDSKISVLNIENLRSNSMKFLCSMASIATSPSPLKVLHFSACGETLIYQGHNDMYPFTKFIRSSPVFLAAKLQSQSNDGNNQISSSQANQGSTHSSGVVMKASDLPTHMTPADVVRHTDGSITTLSFNPDAPNRDIKLQHLTKLGLHEQSLLSLPAWSGVNQIAASVHMTQENGEITIVLNKMPKALYVIGDASAETQPTVVKKDVRAIAVPKVAKTLEGTGVSDQMTLGWRGVERRTNEDDDNEEEGRARKKARIDDA